MTLTWCEVCGEPLELHIEPCEPGRCVAARCRNPQTVGNLLGLCAEHLRMVHAQLGRAR